MKLKATSAGDLNGFLDAGSHIQGELRFDDTFRIDGRLTGKVVSEGDLVVGVGGEIEGEVRVGRVFVSGTVRGRIQASRRLEIAANGRVYADLETPSLVVEDGAFLEGTCSMVTPAKSEAPVKPLTALPLLKER
jgi:cytoskeletal protein CcmA (bactofilin family)